MSTHNKKPIPYDPTGLIRAQVATHTPITMIKEDLNNIKWNTQDFNNISKKKMCYFTKIIIV